MRLDVFLAQHTSEDNAAFEDILSEEHAAARQRNWWLHSRHDTGPQVAALSDNAEAVQALLRDRAAAQHDSNGAGGAVDASALRQHDGLSAGQGINHWVFRPRNQLFFTPDLAVSNHVSKVHSSSAHRRDAQAAAPAQLQSAPQAAPGDALAAPAGSAAGHIVPHTAQRNVVDNADLPRTGSALVALPSSASGMAVYAPRVRLNAAGGRVQPRRLVHAATRMQSAAVDLKDVFLEQEMREGGAGGASQPSRVQQLLKDKASVGGYEYVSTPSPMPGSGAGVHATPEMTWGAVAATPQLAVAGGVQTDTPLVPSGRGAPGAASERERLVSLDSGLLELLLQRAEAQAGLARAAREARGVSGGGSDQEGGTPFTVQAASQREQIARRMARRRAGSTPMGGVGGARCNSGGAPPAGVSDAAMTAARSLMRATPAGTPVFAATGPASDLRSAGQRGSRGVKRGRGGDTPAPRALSGAAAALAKQMGVRPPTALYTASTGRSGSNRGAVAARGAGAQAAERNARAAVARCGDSQQSATSDLL